MQITIHAKAWLILKAESISEGVRLGILQEQLWAVGIDVNVLGGDTLEIPIVNPYPDSGRKKIKA